MAAKARPAMAVTAIANPTLVVSTAGYQKPTPPPPPPPPPLASANTIHLPPLPVVKMSINSEITDGS